MRGATRAVAVLSTVVLGVVALTLAPASAGAGNSPGFAAPFAAWVRAHPVDHVACPVDTCYGSLVHSSSIEPEYSFVQTYRGRVVGYDQALPRGTSLAAAELRVVEQMPSDVILPHGLTVIHRDRYGHSCAVVDLYSPSLAKRFGPKGPAGLGNSIGVELATVSAHGIPHYNPRTADLAIVVPEYLDSSTNC